MANAYFKVPAPVNEPVFSYAPNSEERRALKEMLQAMKSKTVDIPMYIGGEKIFTDEKISIHPPHEHQHLLGHYSKGSAKHVKMAIEAALAAKPAWEAMPWQDRAAIFLRAADLLTGTYRTKMNAATMLGQSKSVYQAEIDCICELADFFRFNAHYMTEIYAQQPNSPKGFWNRMEYRPLEGFVFAITPFNFTAIAGNLCAAPAMLGNTIVWKPAETQIYSAAVIMEILEQAGLPAGVINLILTDGPVAGDIIFEHPDFAGLHFTGSTGVMQYLWKVIGTNISKYKTYPRIVGETGGKDFVLAHPSANPDALVANLIRGAFEYQGQKCSAASRAYIPQSLWKTVKKRLRDEVKSIKIGSTEDFSNFVNAVIDQRAFDKISGYIADAKKDEQVEILTGGKYDKKIGYFIEPTILVVKDPKYRTMCEEIFGPVLTIYVYDDEDFESILPIIDSTSPYALTGAIFSTDRAALLLASDRLKQACGNLYLNDKPTGAVVGQQPFGGARASGTNDKAGSILNMYRWVSPRAIKEALVSATDYRYPFLDEV